MNQTDIDKCAIRNEFSMKIGRLTKSRAYLDFCEEVYGYRTYLFNMMDKEQLDYLLNSIPITQEDTVLDIGCGCGSILELILAEYGCCGTGIDMLDRSYVKFGRNMKYLCGDIDEISDYGTEPSITLSVDSLYFSKNLNKLVQKFAGMKNNRLIFFYSMYLFDEAGDKAVLQGGNTLLAQALSKAEKPFRILDFSENEYQLYVNMQRALKKFEQAFTAENNSDLYGQKLQEVKLGLELFEKGLARRYLYISEAD